MYSKKLILIFACVVLQCSSIVMANKLPSSCKFISSLPTRTMKTIGHSRNNHALVIASGYLRYYDEVRGSQNSSEARYMPLVFRDYDLELLEYSGKYQRLTLEADCATIFMHLAEDGPNWKVDKVDVALEVPNKGIDTCRIEKVDIVQESAKHYRCDSNCGPGVCKSENNDIVDLIFTKLEFEVFGSLYKTSIDQFTDENSTCIQEPISAGDLLGSLLKKVVGKSA